MEAKLKEYRALRRRKELIDNAKEAVEKSKEKLINFIMPDVFRTDKEKNNEEVVLLENEASPPVETEPVGASHLTDVVSEVSEPESLNEENQESWRYFIIKWSIYTVTWLTLFFLFLKLQFGAVFFVVSLLIGIYLNTRTRPRRKGEVSAYSVFNENCVSIDGTLKAEQFEREIRYGPGTVR